MKYSPKTVPKTSSSNQGSVALSSNKPLVKGTTFGKNEVKGDGGTIQKASINSNSARKCFKCQGYGHIASNCPNKKVVTIIEEVIEEGEVELNKEEGSMEEITEYANEGEALVTHRCLNVIQENEESWLRDNIFQTRCTSQGKFVM